MIREINYKTKTGIQDKNKHVEIKQHAPQQPKGQEKILKYISSDK